MSLVIYVYIFIARVMTVIQSGPVLPISLSIGNRSNSIDLVYSSGLVDLATLFRNFLINIVI